jgi:rod shape-determining protein MreC
MKNLLRFLRRNHLIILFLLLEAFSFHLIVNYNSFHRAEFLNYAQNIGNNIYEKTSRLTWYFHLREANNQLVKENTQLRNKLKENYKIRDIERIEINDTAYQQKYKYFPAQVIDNSTNKQYNYLTLNVGSRQGVMPEMGVMSSGGIVGFVLNTSENFCTVISLLNRNIKVSCELKESDYFGSLEWDGRNYRYATLKQIPYHVDIAKGDTIVTSGYSDTFPEGLMVGVINDFSIEEGNFYEIRVSLSNDFKHLNHVYIIENFFKNEIKNLEERTIND